MLKATYDLNTKVLTIFGNEIKTFVETIDEMGEWRTVNDLDDNPLFDVQLDFDDSIDETSADTNLNPENYNLQYVNLIKLSEDTYEMGRDWQNAELTTIKTQPLEVIGVSNEIKFNPTNATFEVRNDKGEVKLSTKSLNKASDYSVLNGGSVIAIDINGIEKKLK
jgi:hypothetical protein